MALLQKFMYFHSGIFRGPKIVINEVLAAIMGVILMRIYSLKSLFRSQQSLVSPRVNDSF